MKCLHKGIHKHFEHTEASEFAEKSEDRWTKLVEHIYSTVHAAKQSFDKQAPLIKYLERETENSQIMP
jgi:hypothetical protein